VVGQSIRLLAGGEGIPEEANRGEKPVRQYWKASLKFIWRLGVLVVGLVLLLAGIIMIVTPGPAIVFIPAGLALLATEFKWARHILHRVRPMIDAAIEKARLAKEAHRQRKERAKAAKATRSSDC
jgi:uncharacterized protein (TIGR02611 family)